MKPKPWNPQDSFDVDVVTVEVEAVGEHWYVMVKVGDPTGSRTFREACLYPEQVRKLALTLLDAADEAEANEAAGARE